MIPSRVATKHALTHSARSASLMIALVMLVLVPATASAATATYTYTPFAANGKVKGGLKVAAQNGECFFSSLTNPRKDTWRCSGRKFLLDPCFRKPGSRHFLICVRTPWSRTAVGLRVPKLKKHGPGQPHPWAVVAEGLQCGWAGGATTSTQYGRLNFACPGRIFLFGLPTSAPDALIWGGSDPQGAGARQYALNEIWF
jgi:hypothetical protein